MIGANFLLRLVIYGLVLVVVIAVLAGISYLVYRLGRWLWEKWQRFRREQYVQMLIRLNRAISILKSRKH